MLKSKPQARAETAIHSLCILHYLNNMWAFKKCGRSAAAAELGKVSNVIEMWPLFEQTRDD